MEYNRDKSTYELVAEWLKEYHSSSDRLKRAKSKTLIVTKMLPIIKKIARTIADVEESENIEVEHLL